MSENKTTKLPQAKSYTSIFDIFGPTPFTNMLYKYRNSKNPNKSDKEQSVYQTTCSTRKSTNIGNMDHIQQDPPYITSERYNGLNRTSSCNFIIPSKSTIFYDLDDVAKRHSFNCLTELSFSNNNVLNVLKIPKNPTHFSGKSNAIVQECATQIHPKLLPRDSIIMNTKKIKKKHPYNAMLSSEIFLKDEEFNDYQKSHYYRDISDRPQKFWSYAKYRTEYTKTIPEETQKKSKKKDKGKRIENPCPCQLFSYACPCTDKKSLTELAKNSKSHTFVDEITSTLKVIEDVRKDTKNGKLKKQKHDSVSEDKPTNTSAVEVDKVPPKNEQIIQVADKHDVPILTDTNHLDKNSNRSKPKSIHKSRKVLCPNCKEHVDVVISASTTEEEECLKAHVSSAYRNKESPPTTTYAFRASSKPRSKTVDDGDMCPHEPRCEMLPVCQILPTDNVMSSNINSKCSKKQSSQKSTPRVIRITKACRHHPPCTVVPSCQRTNVLKNNCEYIPPCLHRPRCVNLPLCVPLSKNLYYEEATSKQTEAVESAECPHIPRCKYIPVCQHDSLGDDIENQINMAPRVQNACEYLSDLNTTAFLVHPKSTCLPTTFSPYPMSSPLCHVFKSTKSCQFDSINYKFSETKEESSNDAVVFIRDVGCQFRNKSYSPKDSPLQSKMSSNSFDFVDVKPSNYYRNFHTLRYEDKFTNPQDVNSLSIASDSSVEIDSQCPSHGRGVKRVSSRNRTTGFNPDSAYIAAFSTLSDAYRIKSDIHGHRDRTFSVKSRRSFLNGKYRKMFTMKRRRKSRTSSRNSSLTTRDTAHSRKSIYRPPDHDVL